MKTNNEMTIDLTKMVACVGVEARDGVINELDVNIVTGKQIGRAHV